jgi:TolB-like protein
LNFCISQIRFALGDSADAPRFVETVPRRGYRFVAPIEPDAVMSGPPSVVTAAAGDPANRWRAAVVAVAQFDNETDDPSFDAVASGVSDATVARLAAPALSPRLAVIGNAPILRRARRFQDVKAIGKALDVEYVVLGQLKKGTDGLRLVAHFIRVRDESHLWARTFDRPALDLAAQAELADRIAQSIAARLATLSWQSR